MEIEMLGRITQFPVRGLKQTKCNNHGNRDVRSYYPIPRKGTETCFFNAINRFHSDPSYYPIPRKGTETMMYSNVTSIVSTSYYPIPHL